MLRNGQQVLVRNLERLGKHEREAMRRGMAYPGDWLWTVNLFNAWDALKGQKA